MAPDALVANLLLFGRLLRRAGIPVHHSRLVDAVGALAWIGVSRRDDVKATLRALLVHRHEDVPRFDAAFDLFFRDRTRATLAVALSPAADRPPPAARAATIASAQVALEGSIAPQPAGDDRVPVAYSPTAVSRTKDFAEFTAAELELARRLLVQLPWRLGERRMRRWQRAGGATIDLRPLLRNALIRGELVELTFRRKRLAPRPIVFIGDVSGSMERYSRVLLHFVYGLARHVRHVESFVFATTLTRITRRVAQRGTERELGAIVRRVSDWGGGTRIGESLRLFNTHWARRVMRHGPVVLLVSDGWDRGDPDELAREMARLHRTCHRVIWLNPLLGTAHYEPLTRGLRAALPYVDDFLPARNLASLEALAQHLSL